MRYRYIMTKLSIQETTFLRNPDKFNENYRYVLTHRIKKKKKDMEEILGVIKKYERSLLTDKEKLDYDEHKAIEYEMEKRKKFNGVTIFTPNLKQRAKAIELKITQLDHAIISFKTVLNKSSMPPTMKKEAKEYIKNLKKSIDNRLLELDTVFDDNEAIESKILTKKP